MPANRDDYVKNMSFLMNIKGNWSLYPYYDVTSSYNETYLWLETHQMTINGKTDIFLEDDMIQFGKSMDIKISKREKNYR